MKRTKNLYLALLAVLLSPMAANADLIDAGDTTLDTVSGLEWLDILQTIGLSYNDVLASSFVLNDGYRYATEAEVNGLYAAAGGTATQAATFLVANKAPSELLLDLMGCSSFLLGFPCDGVPEEWIPAMWGDSSQYIGLIDNRTVTEGILATRWVTYGNDAVSFRLDVGSFLVREVTVPEPGTLALLGIGLFGMGLSRRKKKV